MTMEIIYYIKEIMIAAILTGVAFIIWASIAVGVALFFSSKETTK